ncbi:MAG: cation:proton antiporter [Chthoniobacterales bacterium]
MRDIIIIALLALAVAVEWICCLGLVAMRNPYDRLHASAPANILPPIFIATAVLVHSGVSQAALKTILIALALLFTAPVVTHVIARAVRIREKGELRAEK